MEKLKFTAFTVLIFGGVFIQARLNLLGTLDGAVVLVPTLIKAGNALETFASRLQAVVNALNETSGCFTNGSSKYIEIVATGLMNSASNISDFGEAFANQTTSKGGQLKLLTLNGDLSQVTHAGGKSANALYQVAADFQNFADNIKNALITCEDAKQLVTAIKDITNSIYEFNYDYGAFMGVSITVLNLGVGLLGIGKGTINAAIAIYAAGNATIPIEKRCGASNEISSALKEFGDASIELYRLTLLFL